MPATRLCVAVRANDAAAVRALLGEHSVDVNEACEVEPVVARPHESVQGLYTTLPLFEAVRQRNQEVAGLLLSHPEIDVNKAATRLHSSPFADAVSRGDIEMAEFLLTAGGGRVDPAQGNAVVSHPALYGAMTGHVELLAMLARRGVITDETEAVLLRTAAANGQVAALEWVQNHFIDARPLVALTPGQQIVKIRRVFKLFDDDGNGFVDYHELRALLAGLRLELQDDELREAFLALNTAGDNREWSAGPERRPSLPALTPLPPPPTQASTWTSSRPTSSAQRRTPPPSWSCG